MEVTAPKILMLSIFLAPINARSEIEVSPVPTVRVLRLFAPSKA